MNILIISHMYPSVNNYIAGIFVHQQVKQLIKEGHSVRVISPVPVVPFPLQYLSDKWKSYAAVPYNDIIEGVSVYYPRNIELPRGLLSSSSGLRMFLGIKKTINKIYREFKFDIIHAHVALPDGYAAMIAAKKYAKPLIVTIHGQDMQYTIHEGDRLRKNIEKVINFSKKTIMVSNKLRNIALKELSVPEGKIEVIGNGISLEDVKCKRHDLIDSYRGKKIILSASNLINLKGIDFNLRAIKKLSNKFSDILYLIIGDGPERHNLENLVLELGISDQVKFLGKLPHEKVMEYMAVCDIFSMPSWNEGFGMVYIEAMSNGKPIIACEGQGIQDIIINGINGMLVKPKDVDSLVKSLEYLINDEKKCKEIGTNAMELILKEYTWENNAKKTLRVYNEAL